MPDYPSQDQYQTAAAYAIGEASEERQAAINIRTSAEGVRTEYNSIHAYVTALWFTVSAWCQANQAFIPPEVYDAYAAAYQAGQQHASQGVGNFSLAAANFTDGENALASANQCYGAHQYMYAKYYATYAFQSFQTARNAWDSAYSNYSQGTIQCQQAHDALFLWFQTVNP